MRGRKEGEGRGGEGGVGEEEREEAKGGVAKCCVTK